jgi:hypothetical protein
MNRRPGEIVLVRQQVELPRRQIEVQGLGDRGGDRDLLVADPDRGQPDRARCRPGLLLASGAASDHEPIVGTAYGENDLDALLQAGGDPASRVGAQLDGDRRPASAGR